MNAKGKARKAVAYVSPAGAKTVAKALLSKAAKVRENAHVGPDRPAVPGSWLESPIDPVRPANSPNEVTVSVVIPSYRHAAFVRSAIESVARQTYPHIQLVIVDDGSTDNSVAVIKRTLAKISIRDVVFVRQRNKGAHAAINRGIELARGEYISILNSDDLYHPDRLSRLVDFVTSNDLEFAFTELQLANADDPDNSIASSIGSWIEGLSADRTLGFSLLRANGACTTSNFFFRRGLHRRVGAFRNFALIHDWDFLLRAVLDTEPGFLREPLVFYRQHGSNTLNTQSTLRRSIDENHAVLSDYFRAAASGTARSAEAPTPGNFGPEFFEFLEKPTVNSERHWAFPSLAAVWRTSQLDLSTVQKAFTPPAELIELVGSLSSAEYHAVGTEFLNYFIEYADLEPDAAILDIGCGSGRIGIALTAYLDDSGSYEGFDIVPPAIEWCTETITPKHPNFRFQIADIRNTFYNPDGPIGAAEYTFPHADSTFDFVFLTSVFTHMLPSEFERYVAEISRVLRPGGRCLATFFLENPESALCIGTGKSTLPFQIKADGYRTISAERPEHAVCFPEDYVTSVLSRHRLRLIGPPRYGSWCGRVHFLSYQDILILERD